MKFALATLHIQEMTRSLKFYHEILGLPIIHQFEAGEGMKIAMLGDENQAHIELIEDSRQQVENPGEKMSIGFEVRGIEEYIRKVEQTDSIIKGPISPKPGVMMYFMSDPDGFTVQLLEYQ